MKYFADIADHPIDLETLSRWTCDHACGAEIWFLGKVRNHNQGKEVFAIEYQAYKELAIEEMKEIVSEASAKWPFHTCVFVHRVGKLEVGDISVALLIASTHRKESFEASQWIISEMKKRVPIWKKEFYPDGASWLGLQMP